LNSPARTAPLISVIVAVFNGRETLQGCIDSVALQTYANKELIVVDGGSTDGTINLLQESDQKIDCWISEPDNGIYDAWNKGLQRARGEWVCFLGADDFLWDATVFEGMAKGLGKLPQSITVAYGRIMLIGMDGKTQRSLGEPWEQVRDSFKQYMCIPHVGMMHRRSLFERKGLFDRSFKIAGDYEFLLRELKTGNAAFLPDIIVAGQRYGGISTHADNNLRIKLEVWRAQRMHGLPLPWQAVLWEIANEYVWLALRKVLGERRARRFIGLLKGIKARGC
jgi:GT2 family glycosyltransferase